MWQLTILTAARFTGSVDGKSVDPAAETDPHRVKRLGGNSGQHIRFQTL